jgi:hypothetical protein
MMSKSPFTLLLLFLVDSINMSAIEKLLVCEQMLALIHTGLLSLLHTVILISEKLLVTDLLALLHTDI